MAGFPATIGWDDPFFFRCTDPLAFGRSPRSSEECWVPRWTASVKNRWSESVSHLYDEICLLFEPGGDCSVLVGMLVIYEIGEESASELQASDPV